jgi:hypothetical protein
MRGTSSSITNTYTLKIDKALNKKLDATKRQQSVLYGYTRGGLVITADAATFELLKIAQIYIMKTSQNQLERLI